MAAGVALWCSGFHLHELKQWVAASGALAPFAFVLLGIAALTLLVPKTAVSVLSGAMFGTVLGSLLMLCVAVVAAALNYAIGRWWLRDQVDRALAAASSPNWLRAIREVSAEADYRFHVLMRLTPLPTAVISYAMGASGSRLRPFLLGAGIAVIPQSLWVHGGTAVTAFDEPSSSPIRWLGIVLSIAAATATAIIVPRLAMRRVEALTELVAEHGND
jgi:uncharacterized membrane protein YdjX (TVP38/TMEM64 family)